MFPLVIYADSGLSIFLQVDDEANSRLAYVPGTGLKANRYEITKTAFDGLELPDGVYNPVAAVGDIEDTGTNGSFITSYEIAIPEVGSGGGVVSVRIGVASLTPEEYLEIVQGEQKTITFIAEAKGRFNQAVADEITVKFRDPKKVVQTVEGDAIERVTQELDIQVFRGTLTSEQTLAMAPGLSLIEIAFDEQKATASYAVNILEAITE